MFGQQFYANRLNKSLEQDLLKNTVIDYEPLWIRKDEDLNREKKHFKRSGIDINSRMINLKFDPEINQKKNIQSYEYQNNLNLFQKENLTNNILDKINIKNFKESMHLKNNNKIKITTKKINIGDVKNKFFKLKDYNNINNISAKKARPGFLIDNFFNLKNNFINFYDKILKNLDGKTVNFIENIKNKNLILENQIKKLNNDTKITVGYGLKERDKLDMILKKKLLDIYKNYYNILTYKNNETINNFKKDKFFYSNNEVKISNNLIQKIHINNTLYEKNKMNSLITLINNLNDKLNIKEYRLNKQNNNQLITFKDIKFKEQKKFKTNIFKNISNKLIYLNSSIYQNELETISKIMENKKNTLMTDVYLDNHFYQNDYSMDKTLLIHKDKQKMNIDNTGSLKNNNFGQTNYIYKDNGNKSNNSEINYIYDQPKIKSLNSEINRSIKNPIISINNYNDFNLNRIIQKL
jgi:hypothetical protein